MSSGGGAKVTSHDAGWIRLSRDDELKRAVILETRLSTCTEENKHLQQGWIFSSS